MKIVGCLLAVMVLAYLLFQTIGQSSNSGKIPDSVNNQTSIDPEREWPEKWFSPSNTVERVTIFQNNNALMTIEIPKGNYLSIYHDQPMTSEKEGQYEFHGDVMIRTRSQSGLDAKKSMPAQEVMANAPLILTAKNVKVVVEMILTEE